ncbi:XRE family transcriptional regulator [Gammaproteobacteria bacterium ESL0073]|nr:XRE family transcriptional regulator [Gammaproteobacteria bacterium ESL0073]
MTPFANYLEKLRRVRNLQQKQVADALGITACYVSAMEKGKKGPPTDKVIKKIIDAFRLNEEQQTELWLAVEQSMPIRKLPKNISLEECAFIKELWERLGTLSEEQLIIMSTALKVNQSSDSSQPKWRF